MTLVGRPRLITLAVAPDSPGVFPHLEKDKWTDKSVRVMSEKASPPNAFGLRYHLDFLIGSFDTCHGDAIPLVCTRASFALGPTISR